MLDIFCKLQKCVSVYIYKIMLQQNNEDVIEFLLHPDCSPFPLSTDF